MFEQNFTDFITLLNKYDVKYLVVGGYAVVVHGFPRYTGDMDIWILKSEENADRLVKVVEEFGFKSVGLTREDFLKKDFITQLGYPPLRIDILNDLANVAFEEAWKNKKAVHIEGLDVHFIGLRDLIDAKETAGREKDIQDIKRLKKRNKLK
jgi:predicted nucleotidyltransferase